MKTNLLAAAFAALLSVPAFAQVEVKISFPWAAPPPLVVVEPGIQVVPDYPEEVFFVDGWYWVRRDSHWYHARDYRAGWVYVATPPPVLVRIPPGRYRHWKAHKAAIKQERRMMKEMRRGGYVAPPPAASPVRHVAAPPPAAPAGRYVAAPPPAAPAAKRVDAPPSRGGKGKGKD